MATLAHIVEINASPERVWDMLTALRYGHLWLADIAGVRPSSAAGAGVGMTFEIMRRGTAPTVWTVSEWQPPHQFRFSTTDGDEQYSFLLEPTTNGTQVTMEYQKTARGLGWVLPGTGQRRMVQSSLARLKELISFNRDIALIHGVGDE